MVQTNARRLAINTLFMYIRMGLLMILSLYTSRVVLKALGVEDFGIYNLVGSIVALFSSLRVLFSSATQRFLNYEMGKHNEERLSMVFSMSTIINIVISLGFIVIAEIVGWWFFEFKINIEASRLPAAQIVYQCSIAAAVLSIMTTPYDGVIIAHERMGFYAFLSIVEGGLKLLVAVVVLQAGGDRLILFGVLTLCVAIAIRLINGFYCTHNFKESRFVFKWDRKYFRQMFSFAGWQMLGNTSFALSQNGLNMVLNIFGGPVVNAARGLAYQVSESVNKLLSSVAVVVNPYSIKTFAEGKKDLTIKMFTFSSKTMFLIQLVLSIPIFLFVDKILLIWLGVIPEYTIQFVRVVIIYSLVRSLHGPIDTIFKAQGNLKYYQIIEGVVLLLPIILAYILLYYNFDFVYAFYSIILFEVIDLFSILVLASKQCGFSLMNYFSDVLIHCIIIYLIAFISVYFTTQITTSTNFYLLMAWFSSYIGIFVYMLWRGYNREELSKFKEVFRKK